MESRCPEESVYHTSESGAVGDSPSTEEHNHIAYDKVDNLANSIYKEFESMINLYGENVVQNLMPLVVAILESLDQVYTEKSELEVEFEHLKEEHAQLFSQYEKLKQLKKISDEKTLQLEDAFEEAAKQHQEKVESLESLARLMELKAKNAQDHASRLEEKDVEAKRDYQRLHHRYTELLRSHMEVLERAKFLQQQQQQPTPPNRPSHSNSDVSPMQQTSVDLQTDVACQATGDNLTPTEETVRPVGAVRRDDSDHNLPDLPSLNEEMRTAHDSGGLNERLRMIQYIRDNTPELHSNHVSSVPYERNLPSTAVASRADYLATQASGALSGVVGASGTRGFEAMPKLGLPLNERSLIMSLMSATQVTGTESVFDEMPSMGQEVDMAVSEDGEIADDADIESEFGMSRDIENLIKENQDLIQTKNALNVVKDDLIVKVDELTSENEMFREEVSSLQLVRQSMRIRVTALEHEGRELRLDLEQTRQQQREQEAQAAADNDEQTPLSQRKRFTRAEVARLLLERNQYKESLIDLQESVRWMEMLRANKDQEDVGRSKGKKFWSRLFSNLFRPTGPGTSKTSQSQATASQHRGSILAPAILYQPDHNFSLTSEPDYGGHVRPYGDPNRPTREALGIDHDCSRAFGFLQEDPSGSQRISNSVDLARRSALRDWAKRDPQHVQAYGWSLDTQPSSANPNATQSRPLTVPRPVYCRPLSEKQPGMKLWCASAAVPSSGVTKSGHLMSGCSVFYHWLATPGVQLSTSAIDQSDEERRSAEEIDRLDRQLRAAQGIHEGIVGTIANGHTDPTSTNYPSGSLVWICTLTSSQSQVIVVDANQPADFVDSFYLNSHHALSIACVPGAQLADYEEGADWVEGSLNSNHTFQSQSNQSDDEDILYRVTGVQCSSNVPCAPPDMHELQPRMDMSLDVDHAADPIMREPSADAEEGAPSVNSSAEDDSDEPTIDHSTDVTSIQATMWIGCDSGDVFVHSAVSSPRRCLHTIKLNDAVTGFAHLCGRVFAALANASLAVFQRRHDNGQWDLSHYHWIQCGRPQHAVRAIVAVPPSGCLWAGLRNRIFVVEATSLRLITSFDAHPRRDSQVRHLCWAGEGVWVSIRLETTLRLYHAFTHQHLQDVDVEPQVSRVIDTSKLGLSLIRVTSLVASSDRLWVGTGNGVIATFPFTGSTDPSSSAVVPCRAHLYSDPTGNRLWPASFVPFVDPSTAQVSFHGHRDAVKFFVEVPGFGDMVGQQTSQASSTEGGQVMSKGPGLVRRLVLSGGEGYLDFRMHAVAEEEEKRNPSSRRNTGKDQSHLIVWQM